MGKCLKGFSPPVQLVSWAKVSNNPFGSSEKCRQESEGEREEGEGGEGGAGE